MNDSLPANAGVVVIGGGVIGTSIAFHLARAGAKEVILLEKASLTEGATWHAAGLVGQFRSQQNLMSLMNNSVRLFDGLADETGQDPGWRKVGSLRLANTRDRWKELLKSYSSAQAVGFEMNMLSPRELKDMYPLLEVDDLVGAAFIPADGYIDPNSLTQAYARGFRQNGGRIFERVMVTGLIRDGDRIKRIETAQGDIECEIVVNAAGLWARQLGWMAGVEIPAAVVQHQYLVTEKTHLIPDNLPAMRDPDGGFYAKPEPGALAIGGWEQFTPAVDPIDGFGWDNERFLFDGDMDRIEEFFAPAMARIPLLAELGVRSIVNGPIPISPDGEPIMGPVPGLSNFYAACAFTSGIAASGGAGQAMANWILHGDPGLDLWPFDIRRFGPLHAGRRFLHERAIESYRNYYALHWPGEELESARGVRRSPLYETLKRRGAVFGAKFGWERANWFAYGDIAQQDVLGFDRPQQDVTVGREHLAAREAVILIDMSSFTKFEIEGAQAAEFLQYLAVADVDRAPGSACYTQLCNHRGGIEADVTLIRRDEDRYWLITGSAFGVRDRNWIETNLHDYRARFNASAAVKLRDITSAYGVINLAGPLAREVLRKVCDDDVSHSGFPFMSTRQIRVGYAPALAYRVTYIGELGWELYIPSEYLQYAYEILLEAGTEFGITDIGYRAVDSLRLEKCYLAWGVDISPDYNPLEAGLGFLVDWSKEDFIGATALKRIREAGVGQKMACLSLDDPLPVFGGEAVFSGDRVIAQTTSGNFGYSVGKSLVLAYLPVDQFDESDISIEAFGERSSATLIQGAVYDPKREKILC